jgi:hypothetical protein
MIIDADIHVTLDTVDNLRGRLPERYQQRERYFNQDEYDRNLGGTLAKHGVTAEQHLADMALEGIDVQVLFPTGMLGYGNNREAELAVALCRAYNNWLHDFCAADRRRFRGAAAMPLQDVRAAIQELHRAVGDLGMIAALIPTTVYPGKDLGGREFDDFYGEVQRLGVPLAVHRTSATGAVGFERFTNFTAMHAVVPMYELSAAVANMVIGGVFERFPDLKVAYLEAGVGWVPWLVHMLDEHCEIRAPEVPHLKARPSEYLGSGRVFFSFEPGEPDVPRVAEVLGESALLFSSDYPHWDSPFPNSVRTVRERTDMSERLKERVLTHNPAACYGIPAEVGVGGGEPR